MKVIDLSARRAKVIESENQFRARQADAIQANATVSRQEYTPYRTTLLDLVTSLQDTGRSDVDVVNMVSNLVNSGRVRLCGNFAGQEIPAEPLGAAVAVG